MLIPTSNALDFRNIAPPTPEFQLAWMHFESLDETVAPSSLAHIFCFHRAVLKALDAMPDKELVMMVARNPIQISKAALLLAVT